MPCYPRERQKFEIWRRNKQEQKASGGEGFNFRKELDDEGNTSYERLKKKLDDHLKALEDLRRKLRESTSESEKARLRKEIEDLEKEVQGYEDTIEELIQFVRDVGRRTIGVPSRDDSSSN